MEPRTTKILLIVFFILGAAILILGCVLGFVVFPNLIETAIIENVELVEGTKQYDRFLKIPFPISFKLTFFHLNNSDEATAGGNPPILEERGPYIYDETRTKDITALKKDDLGFNENFKLEFNAEKSNGLSDEDIIRIPNAPLIAIMQKLEDLPLPLPISLDALTAELFENTNLFIDITVKDFTFGGLKMCEQHRMKTSSGKLICLVTMIMKQKLLEYHDDRSMSFSVFGYKISKPDGPFELKRGIHETEKLGLITKFDNKEYTSFWKGTETSCDRVEGRNGLFPPFMTDDMSFKVYSSDICRSATINFAEKVTFKGVEGLRFQMSKTSFSNPSESCICIEETKDIDGNKTCFNDGLLDLHNCFGGSPVVLSFPHLMWAQEKYQNSVIGLHSEFTNDHNTFLDFQPDLGIPLRAAIRIQFNIIMRPMLYGKKVIESTKGLTPSMFPILWLEDGFELTDELIEEMNDELFSKLKLAEIVKWVAIGVGILVLVVTTAFCIVCCVRSKGKEYV